MVDAKRSRNLRVRSSGGGIALVDGGVAAAIALGFSRLGEQNRENFYQLFITSESFRFVIEFSGVASLTDKISSPFERPGKSVRLCLTYFFDVQKN